MGDCTKTKLPQSILISMSWIKTKVVCKMLTQVCFRAIAERDDLPGCDTADTVRWTS